MVSRIRRNNRARRSVKKGGAAAAALFAAPAPPPTVSEIRVHFSRIIENNQENTVISLFKRELAGKILHAARLEPPGLYAPRQPNLCLKMLTEIERVIGLALNSNGFIIKNPSTEDERLRNSDDVLRILNDLDFALDDPLFKSNDLGNKNKTAIQRFDDIVRILDDSMAFNFDIIPTSGLARLNAAVAGGTRKRRKSKKGGKRRKSHKR